MQTLRFFALRRNYRRKRHAPFFFLTFLPSDGRLVAKSCSLFVAACIHAPYRRRVRWYDSTRAVSRAVGRKISSRVASLYFFFFLSCARAQLCDRSDLGRAVFFFSSFPRGLVAYSVQRRCTRLSNWVRARSFVLGLQCCVSHWPFGTCKTNRSNCFRWKYV